jgi:hypothetical protein
MDQVPTVRRPAPQDGLKAETPETVSNQPLRQDRPEVGLSRLMIAGIAPPLRSADDFRLFASHLHYLAGFSIFGLLHPRTRASAVANAKYRIESAPARRITRHL